MSTAEEQQISIDDVSEELLGHKRDFDEKMAEVTTLAGAEALRREYLGKKGPINKVMGYMRVLSNEDKPKLGAVVNEVKSQVEATVAERMQKLEFADIEEQMKLERIDVTKPGLINSQDIGRRHPLGMTLEKALDIFTKLGYDTVTGCKDSPEIETDYYCFEALNCPKDHPARDMQDTFYLTKDLEYMLRTHTSAVQIRQLEKRKPPLRIVAPGRVYRKDDIDATHSLMFHQVEILALEKRGELDLGHLKGTVEHFLKGMFGPNIQVRFRGSFFPFTEPSMEVDVFFRGRWLEVLGCGMVDPRVLEMAGIDPEVYSGFAAGFGLERFAMVMHQITDLREFTKNDVRFVKQFPHFYDDGLEAFLEGKVDNTPVVDPRGETVPQPFVDSLEELKERGDVNEAPAAEETPKRKKKAPAPAAEIDVSKLDIRVGIIQKAWEHPEADKLFCEEIDLGEEGGPRQIASGLKAHYNVEDLEGRKVLVLANLKARKLVGFPSHGMVLCAVNDDGKVVFVDPPEGAEVGERVMVAGFDGEPATENQVIKKKMLDAIFPDLKTNDEGVATYRGTPITTSAGPCKSELSNASIS
ncbi:Phenylalanine--tRNA ligase alpha subunit [Seminavis robusta]|uniref:Phenylalanine--tRNA ligase alpha subunit n=1 Tax=Seminavis robusta TaxID=568900 RepID=A0A9N8H8Z1_9STRA|nr:Phenylalanine--tRNA ligase alpha subunit [Seminavis robusta]|eukprot:Sro174_g076640.1 Phenylalanine--tRNA ligase alpha subunit (583) ;mRNA; r:41873-43736